MGDYEDYRLLHRRLCSYFRRYPLRCQPTTKDHDQGMARDDQRVLEGMETQHYQRSWSSGDLLGHADEKGANATSASQNQKTEAITGVSSEGYNGPGMVQSRSGKKE